MPPPDDGTDPSPSPSFGGDIGDIFDIGDLGPTDDVGVPDLTFKTLDLNVDVKTGKLENTFTDLPVGLHGIEGDIFVQYGKGDLVSEKGEQILNAQTGSPVYYAEGIGLIDTGTGRVLNYRTDVFMIF